MALFAKRVRASIVSSSCTSVSSAPAFLPNRKTRSMIFLRSRGEESEPSSALRLFVAMGSVSGKRGAHLDVAKACRSGPVAGTHGLHGLPLPAVRRAPQSPVLLAANGVAGIPELRANAAVAGIFQHANFLAAFNFPADLGGELKLV